MNYNLRQSRNLTEKGTMMYDEQCTTLQRSCDTEWNHVEDLLIKLPECNDVSSLRALQKDIDRAFSLFRSKSEDFKGYLSRQCTPAASEALQEHSRFFESCSRIISKAHAEIRDKKLDFVEAISELSAHSTHSGSVASRKKAKAAAERTRLEYIKKESQLVKKKAEIEADISVIKQEGVVAAADAEAQFLEDDVEAPEIPALDQVPTTDKKEDIQRFIQQSKDIVQPTVSSLPFLSLPVSNFPPPVNTHPISVNNPYSTFPPIVSHGHEYQLPSVPLNVHPVSSAAAPQQMAPSNLYHHDSLAPKTDITRYMLRHDYMLSRFVNFDDKPESFPSWKASFQNVLKELQVVPFEEMDLLVRWLGPASSSFAKTIRSANAHDPSRGVACIWERLHERYGRPEMVEQSLKKKIAAFPTLTSKDNVKLYDLLDILIEIESCMNNQDYSTLLAYFNSSSGVSPIVAKLPYSIQEKWATHASKYKKAHSIPFPPFPVFVSFIKDLSEVRNDPAFVISPQGSQGPIKQKHTVLTRKLEVENVEESGLCPLHKAGHSLNDCRAFRRRPFADRKKFLKDKGICFRCCTSTSHLSKDCTVDRKCSVCDSPRHATALHIYRSDQQNASSNTAPKESSYQATPPAQESVISRCSAVCGDVSFGRSCGKTVLVDIFSENNPMKVVRAFALIDDQSNQTLGSPSLLNQLGMDGQLTQVTMSTCSGRVSMAGRFCSGICIKSLDGKTIIKLPRVLECDSIPWENPEIATPEVVQAYPHLRSIAKFLPHFDGNTKVELLIGRDLPEVHHVHEQIVGGNTDPFAQRLSLGWVVVGEVCLGKVHAPSSVVVRRTNVLDSGRCTTFPLCENRIEIKIDGDKLFQRLPSDNIVGPSIEDKCFLNMMDSGFHLDDSGHWSAPLPFKESKGPLPNNRPQAWKRAQILHSSLLKNSTKLEHFITFMAKVINSGAAEVAPTEVEGECWYLPLFGVYHPKKPNQIRGVFDSSAVYEGVSLNSVLMSGPDLLNNLVGVLMCFRKDAIAITGDIEQMFYQFHVDECHRNYLRFFWYRNNDFSQPLIEYRMTAHVFGNTPSPAIATYGIRKAVEKSDHDVLSFVNNNFYVDDALISLPERDLATDLMRRTKEALFSNGKIRLHKIVSNNIDVMKSFESEDLGKDLKDLNLSSDRLPLQRSLGLSWNLETDMFIFSVDVDDKPCTRRGLLSCINSIFDPLGFLSPLTISGKMLLWELIPPGSDWDDPLSEDHTIKWLGWISSLKSVDSFKVPRMFVPSSLSSANSVQLHIFSDASEQAVAAVVYLRVVYNEGQVALGFVAGKSKLAPLKGHTIPRLELCGAVVAVEVAEFVCTQLGLSPDLCFYHTDSKVVLGYICNTSRRFFTYVSNRVEKIVSFSKPHQWSFVPTDRNPADLGTRFLEASNKTAVDSWIRGPDWLLTASQDSDGGEDNSFPLVNPDNDKEVRSEVVSCHVNIRSELDLHYLEKFSSWSSLIRAFSTLRQVVLLHTGRKDTAKDRLSLQKDTQLFLIRLVQKHLYHKEIDSLTARNFVGKHSQIAQLDPILDDSGVLRVGGRLKHSKYDIGEKHPILFPGNTHLAELLILHYHESCHHSGRHITEGSIRSAGFWITGLKRKIYSVISKCVLCQRFRGKSPTQKMADLPVERLSACPPFTYVGVDCFGPWDIVTRRTRGGCANSKRWAVIFVCLSCRGIHIEVIEEMSTSSFVNALRRFVAVRGKVKEFLSDRGSNFIGGAKELGISAIFVEDSTMKSFLDKNEAVWKFNTPYSSHHGGSWERLIGIVRRVLDSILYGARHRNLTHESLSTFMSEAMAIVNSRPLAPIPTDHEAPCVLSPNALLTQKVGSAVEDFSHLSTQDVYSSQWKFVQNLADQFWHQWRHHYLQSLQGRRKWMHPQVNICEGDLVILKQDDLHRNQWPLGLIECVYPGNDNLVRKVKVRVIKDGKPHEYVRPITQIVLLCHGCL